jgi:hypothetical protein
LSIYPFQGYKSGIRRKHKEDATRTAQKIIPNVALTKRAHLFEQTGVPRHKSPRIITWTHLLTSQRKMELGEAQLGSVELQVRPNLDAFRAS